MKFVHCLVVTKKRRHKSRKNLCRSEGAHSGLCRHCIHYVDAIMLLQFMKPNLTSIASSVARWRTSARTSTSLSVAVQVHNVNPIAGRRFLANHSMYLTSVILTEI